VRAVYANRLAPGLLDRYLARTNYEAQQDDDPVEPGRPDNLFAPIAGDHGAHGRFDAESRARSWLLDLRLVIGDALDVFGRGSSRGARTV
jgi:hypothetical protein